MAIFVLSCLVLGLFIYTSRLSERINAVEKRLKETNQTSRADTVSPSLHTAAPVAASQAAPAVPSDEARPSSQHAPIPTPDTSPTNQSQIVAQRFSPTNEQSPESSEFFIYTWFKHEPLIKIGGLLFFLGMVWFVGYAVNQAWLPPEAQIFLSYLLAVVAYSVGRIRADSAPAQHIVLTCLGTGIVLATTFAAQFVYELLLPAFALVIISISIAYTVMVSIAQRVEWLAVAAAVAGLAAPLLVNSPEPQYALLLAYLLVLAGSFLTVVWFTAWRVITFVLVCGVGLYLTTLLDIASAPVLWLFTVAFTAIFFASTAVSLLRSHTAHTLDVVNLGIIGLLFVLFADVIALHAGIATSIATVVVASVASFAYVHQYSHRVIAIFLATTVALGLIATGHLFTGDILVIVYMIQVTVAFLLLQYLSVSDRAQLIAASLYALPVALSLEPLFSGAWESGVPVAAALSTGVVAFALWLTATWCYERIQRAASGLNTVLATVFFSVSYAYSVVLIQRWATAFLSGSIVSDGFVLTYIGWATMSLIIIHYFLQREASGAWIRKGLFTLVLPIFASLSSITASAWDEGIVHRDAIGVYTILGILSATALLLLTRYTLGQRPVVRQAAVIVSLVALVYFFVMLIPFWRGVFGPGTAATAALYTSYTLVTYAIFSVLITQLAAWRWVNLTISLFIIPVLFASVALLASTAWETIWHPHLVGVFVVITVLALVGMRLQIDRSYTGSDVVDMQFMTRVLMGTAALLSVGAVWRIIHSVAPSADVAVTIALLLYSVMGLVLYSMGRARELQAVKTAGILLLVLVVARLVVVDVWSMDTLPRIATFLGIGFLFILTALVEKPFAHKQSEQSVE